MAVKDEHLAKQAESVEKSAVQLRCPATAIEPTADRNTVLAADRTVLAAERTYAAWVRTGLAAMASGAAVKALLGGVLPSLWGSLIGTVLSLQRLLSHRGHLAATQPRCTASRRRSSSDSHDAFNRRQWTLGTGGVRRADRYLDL
jgi:hypothetical protein